MNRDFTLRKVVFSLMVIPPMMRVHAPNGDAVGAIVVVDLSTDEERARRQGMPVPFWCECVVVEPREFPGQGPDLLFVRHRDYEAFYARVIEAMGRQRHNQAEQ